mmetsp:Transcript_69680/g.187678  ORF Transcript_69680/g.187678 Transcript_69680/m.187678 type:complete len:441 (+) Transcript_69680:89-1411(+)
MLNDDIAKARFHYYEHFVRGNIHKAPPGVAPWRHGIGLGRHLEPRSPRKVNPSAAENWRRSPSPPRVRPVSGRPGVRQLSPRRAPSTSAPLPRPTSAPGLPERAATRAASSGPGARPRSRSQTTMARAPSGGVNCRRPRARSASFSERPTSAPPCVARPGQNPAGSAHAASNCRPGSARHWPASPGALGLGNSHAQRLGASYRLGASPAHGSIYHGIGEACRNPGPGEYPEASHTTQIGADCDPSQPSAWGVCGRRAHERMPENLEMYNTTNPNLGPGTYDPCHPPCVAKRTSSCNFSHLRQLRMPPDGSPKEGMCLPAICHTDARFAHRLRQKPPGEARVDDHAWEQGLVVRCARPVAAMVDQCNQETHLEFQGASFRLGGQLIIPAGNEAGPTNVPADVANARAESLQTARAKAKAKCGRTRPPSANRAWVIGRAQRF